MKSSYAVKKVARDCGGLDAKAMVEAKLAQVIEDRDNAWRAVNLWESWAKAAKTKAKRALYERWVEVDRTKWVNAADDAAWLEALLAKME